VKLWPTAARKVVRDEKRALKAAATRFARGARAGRRLINMIAFINRASMKYSLNEVVVKKNEDEQMLLEMVRLAHMKTVDYPTSVTAQNGSTQNGSVAGH